MDCLTNLPFNKKPPTKIHVDLNSCFASIEQQANRHLRNKPVAVAAYNSPNGCILAASYEAKALGIKTGTRVQDGMVLCPGLIVMSPDAAKYKYIHSRFRQLFSTYSHKVTPKSIDEFIIDLEGCPSYKRGMHTVALEMRKRIKDEIGDSLRVNIGIATNNFLAKTAASLHKPEGMDEINEVNHIEIFKSLNLKDLCGIDKGNASRLNSSGIFSVLDLYEASSDKLKRAFRSIMGHHWFYKMRGWEVEDIEFDRKSYGNSYALPLPLSTVDELAPLLTKLTQKAGQRLRKAGYKCQGIYIAISYRDFDYWHVSVTTEKALFDSRDIYKELYRLLCHSPSKKPVRTLAISCFNLSPYDIKQGELFEDIDEKAKLVEAIDGINERWGNFVLTPGRMIGTEQLMPERIPFGASKEIEEFHNSEDELRYESVEV